ncbi:MAG: VOC family protein [Actinomycetota bacterium]
MTLGIAAITFDCTDALAVARFWSAALDRPIDEGQPAPSPFFASIGRDGDPEGRPAMLFIAVPEGKETKNRVHLDLAASDRAAEVDRLLELGATRLHDKDEWGMSWTTLADPEGNELCVAQHA